MINNQDKVSKYMTRSLITVNIEQTLRFANDLMKDNNIRHLPVLEDGSLVGVISERDIHYLESFTNLNTSDLIVEDAYSDNLCLVDSDTSVQEACTLMKDSKIGSVVIKEKKELAGIFTWIDALSIIAQ